jgi:hypothetical protein
MIEKLSQLGEDYSIEFTTNPSWKNKRTKPTLRRRFVEKLCRSIKLATQLIKKERTKSKEF